MPANDLSIGAAMGGDNIDPLIKLDLAAVDGAGVGTGNANSHLCIQ